MSDPNCTRCVPRTGGPTALCAECLHAIVVAGEDPHARPAQQVIDIERWPTVRRMFRRDPAA